MTDRLSEDRDLPPMVKRVAGPPVDVDRVEASPPRSTGQQIDDLVSAIPSLAKAVTAADEAYGRARTNHRRALNQLVELVGRPTAARLLELTPRELAGMMRGQQ